MNASRRITAVTIVDVARAANVSRATASRALAGYGRIRPATRDRVQAVAEQLGYRPNSLARAMRAGRSATIGLIVTDIANPFFAQATKAVARAANEFGYDVVVADTNEDEKAERRAIRVFLEKRVDGLIVVPAPGRPDDDQLGVVQAEGTPTPLVLLDRRRAEHQGASVTSDDFRSAVDAVSLLVSNGHTRIGMIDGNWASSGFTSRRPRTLGSAASERIDGFREGMKRSGLSPRPGWMLYASARERYAAQAAAASILGQADRPTALVTNNSDIALAVLTVCQNLGLEIGSDLSLITFDDASWAAAFSPPISAVARPVAQMGEAAVRELVAQIGGRPPSPAIVLKNDLIERRSVGAPGGLSVRLPDGASMPV
jgi:LacI family transcriptional regulator